MDIVDLAREEAAALQTEAEGRAASTITAAHEEVAVLLSEARNRAECITAAAGQQATAQRAQANETAAAARGEADQLLSEARDRAARILSEARGQVAALIEQAAADHESARTAVAEMRSLTEADLAEIREVITARRDEAAVILTRAQEEADQLRVAAQREVDQAHERITSLATSAATAYAARRAEGEKLYTDAVAAADGRRREAEEAVAGAHAEAEAARTELREQLRTMGETFDKEAAEKRAALDADLAGLRAACDEQRERLRREATTVAAQLRDTAQKNAARIIAEAEKKANGISARAQADEARARRMLDEAREAKKQSSRRQGWSQKFGRRAWKTAPWIALAAGVGLAASGEYELARMVGINAYVAPLLPVSIDVYCVTAFRAKRDIPAALLLMASANVTYHLSEQAHIVKEGQSAPWQLTTFVVLIFVAVIWRVHALMHEASTDGHAGTDGHASTDTATGTDGRTSTAARTGGPTGTQHARTTPPGTDSYGTAAGTQHARTGPDAARTQPVRGNRSTPALTGANAAVTSAYSDRTSGVQGSPHGAAPASTEHSGRTSAAAYEGGTRTSTVTARATPGDEVPALSRTSTGEGRPRTNGTASGGRTGTAIPPRPDGELLPLVRELPREDDGYVNISRVRTQLGVNQTRAVRLLKEAGLLRPSDADKYLK
ncbi:hypothetical protein [Streptomyces chartreusis]|uniref:hypothetical protein n=1 Tax=Streptomyces chartreusis TaxID=1969 RepID=UPI0027E4252D|nr:hypothetical protein [Streptomyces chartreusis]